MFHRQATTRGTLAAGMGMGISSAKNGNTSPPFGQVPPLVLLLGYKWHLSKTVLNPAEIIISHVCLCLEKKVFHVIPFGGALDWNKSTQRLCAHSCRFSITEF